MGKQIIDLISNFVKITDNSIVDSVLFAIIAVISFSVAFGFVGMLFDAIGHYDSDVMSDVHWGARVVVFVVLTWILVKLAQLIKWLFSFEWWIYLIFFVVLIVIVGCIYYLRSRAKEDKCKVNKPHTQQNDQTNEEKIEKIDSPAIIFDKYHCPRCHSKLVKRHGPYGDFYGCESFGKIGCRYTRKYL